jgi:hypothetical protein
MGQVQRLIRNFLWSGQDESKARAKVAWKTIILPRHMGGLGIIDPWDQCQALLGKFIIGSFLPNVGPWKSLLHRHLYKCAPKTGGPWDNSIRWVFLQNSMWHTNGDNKSSFAIGILRAWKNLQHGLKLKPLLGIKEYERQPILWNPRFRTEYGHMLGSRP